MHHHNAAKFRWPAISCDAGGHNAETFDFTGINVNVEGALYTLPTTMDIKSMGFETEPGKYLARAFQDYGAYLVDGTGWSVYAIETEWGPGGRVIDEFQKAWGFPFQEFNMKTPWFRDMARIFDNLHMVINAARGKIVVGPDSDFANRRAPRSPAFASSTGVKYHHSKITNKDSTTRFSVALTQEKISGYTRSRGGCYSTHPPSCCRIAF